jgi:hypothetical protein
LKFLKLISNADKTVVRDREKPFANIIFKYDEYIPIVEELCNKCYDEDYWSELFLKKCKYDTADIDFIYVWSLSEKFVKLVPQKNETEIVKTVQNNKSLTA